MALVHSQTVLPVMLVLQTLGHADEHDVNVTSNNEYLEKHLEKYLEKYFMSWCPFVFVVYYQHSVVRPVFLRW